MAEPLKPFTMRFSVGGNVDTETGILESVTVAEVGAATGHFACLDKAGNVIGVDDPDIPGTARRIPLMMDAKGIEMVVRAGNEANRIKAREDHDDSIGARAGFVNNFRVVDGKAVCDLTTLDNYRHRALFLEAAQKTPEMIGLSGEFRFVVEVIGGEAFMRVGGVDAVDIVDTGALTHAGLFRALKPRASVDRSGKTKSRAAKPNKQTFSAMADAPKVPPAGPGLDPDNDGDIDVNVRDMPDLDAFKSMCEEIASYAKGVGALHDGFASKLKDAMASISPVTVPTPEGAPAPVSGQPSNKDASVDDPKANFTALRSEFSQKLAEVEANTVRRVTTSVTTEMKKQFAALGIKPTAAPAPAAEVPAADASKDEPKTFFALKAKIQRDRGLKPTEATHAAMKERPDLYRDYIKGLGIYDPSKDHKSAAK